MSPVATNVPVRRGLYWHFGKRLFDFTSAFLGLLLLLPFLAVVAVLVRFKLGHPVLFRQQRPGKDAAPFTIFKFRTMTDKCDSAGKLLPDSERLTAFGNFLRSSSIDELPELWNVVKGDMSLVGPRPLMMKYVPLYSAEQARRHNVRPGITGLAQVNGRNAISWDQKFDCDLQYVDNVSLSLDLKILFRTFAAVVTRHGISNEGHATMPEFTGSPATPAAPAQVTGTKSEAVKD